MRRSHMRLRQLATVLVVLGAFLLTAAENDGTAVTLANASFPTKCTENGKSGSNEDESTATEKLGIPTELDQDEATTLKGDETEGDGEEKEEIVPLSTTTTAAPYVAPKNGKQPEFYVDDA